jgi:hypothetical protein
MGYTNYWRWATAITDADKFAAWSKDVEHLLEYLTTPGRAFPDYIRYFSRRIQNSEGPIFCGPDGKGHPIITSEIVAFNGNASLGQDEEAIETGLRLCREIFGENKEPYLG